MKAPLWMLCLSFGLVACQDDRVTSLEHRVEKLEQSVQQLQTEKNKLAEDDAARHAKLESCVADANAEFQRNVANNGTKSRNGTYSVPVPVLTEMQRQKQSKIEECRLLYSASR